MERWPRDTPKVIFLFYFLGWKYPKCKHRDCTFKSQLKHLILLPFGSVESRWLCNKLWKDVLVRIRSNYYFYLLWFFKILYWKSFLLFVFYWMVYLTSLSYIFHIFISLFCTLILFILKQNTVYIYMNMH